MRMTSAGAASLMAPGAVCVLADSAMKQGGNDRHEEILKTRAIAAFKRFEEVWNFNDFWKRGNTMDACVTFAHAALQRWPDDSDVEAMQVSVGKMLKQDYAFFHRFNPEGLWADDFGWWGLLALNARRHLLSMDERKLADQYWDLSTNLCWEYKKKTAYDATPDAKPVPHGCRNGDAGGRSRGVKNTVTNVLLFLLSSRIYRYSLTEDGLSQGNEKYLDMAYRQWVWFDSWFRLEKYGYLRHLKRPENDSPDGALVQERPMAIFEGSDYQEKVHPPWVQEWAWTGDQGMLVAALADMLAIKEPLAAWIAKTKPDVRFDVVAFEKRMRMLIKLLGHGIKSAFVGDVDGILREAPCRSSFGPAHANDYVAGRGIMMRYLGGKEIKPLLGDDMSESVTATTDAIWQTRDVASNQFKPEFTTRKNDKIHIEQFRELWGTADDVCKWSLDGMNKENKRGVCQSIGLDVIGAAIKQLHPPQNPGGSGLPIHADSHP